MSSGSSPEASDTGSQVGTAPGASWIAARVFDDAGASTLSGLHAAFQWLLDPDGDPATDDAPDVVNASWVLGSAPSCNLALQPDVQALRAAGILPVFAAGNFGSGASSSASPANYPESCSVGAVRQQRPDPLRQQPRPERRAGAGPASSPTWWRPAPAY